jgi:Mycotoxin biosynthesis protein UstYa
MQRTKGSTNRSSRTRICDASRGRTIHLQHRRLSSNALSRKWSCFLRAVVPANGLQHAIRVAYYVDEHTLAVQTGTAEPDDYMERMAYTVNRKHMRHCFDYLRRVLMCGADSNLESVSPDSHVTTGWGDERVCRDYAGVLAWSEQWRNTDDVGIAEPPPDEIPTANSQTEAMAARHARTKRLR